MNNTLFEANEVLPGITHIKDAMGVCMTLLTGTDKALLIDTGYGIHDVKAFVNTLTALPLEVILTHAHHDHAIGARCFEKTFMFTEDLSDFDIFTGRYQRERVMTSAKNKGIGPSSEEEYLTCAITSPSPLQEGEVDLGGLTAEIIRCPGHTPGSAMVYVPQYKLLLSGDNWNPCTWLFFESAVPVKEYRKNLTEVLSRLDVEKVLCSHQHKLYDYSALERFINNLTDKNLNNARPVDIHPYEDIDTRQIDMPDGQLIVFDYRKL